MALMGADLPVSAIRGQIVSGIDIFVHLGRIRDKSRKLLEIAELDGLAAGEVRLNILYRFVETGEEEGKVQGRWDRIGALRHKEKWEAAGF